MSDNQEPTMMFGEIPIYSRRDVPIRLSLFLWGAPGSGKTTFAATAPGKKLWLNFDPDGFLAVAGRDDVYQMELADADLDWLMNNLLVENPLGLDKLLEEHPEFETVVLDSGTMLFYRCLEYAVREGFGKSKRDGFTPTMAAPGITAYGARSNVMTRIVSSILRLTVKHNRHFIMTAHEKEVYEKNEKGQDELIAITMSLSDTMINNTTPRISDIWYMRQERLERHIYTRPFAKREPAKSRMFQEGPNASFKLQYDPSKPDEQSLHTIAKWIEQWSQSRGQKVPVPK